MTIQEFKELKKETKRLTIESETCDYLKNGQLFAEIRFNNKRINEYKLEQRISKLEEKRNTCRMVSDFDKYEKQIQKLRKEKLNTWN